jgi:hypothetical protein
MQSRYPPCATSRLSLDPEALTVAMAIAPGAYARNRLFALYQDPEVRQARARASLLRGLARQLAGSHGPLEGLAIDRSSRVVHMRYRIAAVRMDRRSHLSELEAACVMHLAARGGAPGFAPSAEDRARLEFALRRLAGFGDAAVAAIDGGGGDETGRSQTETAASESASV